MNEPDAQPVVVVTGTSSGIGRSIVSLLTARGFRVVAGVRQMDDAADLRQLSDLILPVLLDVTDQDSIAAAVATVQSHFPAGIDGLVNNAGVAVAGPVELVPRSQWLKQFDVNVFGMISVTQGFLPMLRRRQGRIINISSASSSLALPMIGPYASSKSAVEALSDSLRRELRGSGVKVVIICPGQTATPIFAKSEQQARSSLEPGLQTGDQDYMSALNRFQELMHQSADLRRPPARVASVVVKALTAKRPKRRYHVGWDAYMSVFIDRFVPASLVDWIVARTLRPTPPRDSGKGST